MSLIFTKEFRVGFLVLLALVIAYFGSLYLKNYGTIKSQKTYYAIGSNTYGITSNTQIVINGLMVGKISDMRAVDSKFKQFILSLQINNNVEIPINSQLVLKNNMLASNQLILDLGDSKQFLQHGDTLISEFSNPKEGLGVLLNKTSGISDSLKMLISNVSELLDQNAKKHFTESLSELSIMMKHIKQFSISLDTSSKYLVQSLKNIQIFTSNLNAQNEVLNKSIKNLHEISINFASPTTKKMLLDLSQSADQLNSILKKIDNKEGSLGLLVNDKKLYENLENSSKNLNSLIIDLTSNPKKYVNISVFGKNKKDLDSSVKK